MDLNTTVDYFNHYKTELKEYEEYGYVYITPKEGTNDILKDCSYIPCADDLEVTTSSCHGLKNVYKEVAIHNNKYTYTRDLNELPSDMTHLHLINYIDDLLEDDLFGIQYCVALLKDLEKKHCKSFTLTVIPPSNLDWDQYKGKVCYLLDHLTTPDFETMDFNHANDRSNLFECPDEVDLKLRDYALQDWKNKYTPGGVLQNL